MTDQEETFKRLELLEDHIARFKRYIQAKLDKEQKKSNNKEELS